jgi:hypothetical protein
MLKTMAAKTKHANEPTNYSLQRALRPSIEEPNSQLLTMSYWIGPKKYQSLTPLPSICAL